MEGEGHEGRRVTSLTPFRSMFKCVKWPNLYFTPQNRQSARLFLQSFVQIFTIPSPRASCPPPLVSRGVTLACGKGVEKSQFGRWDKQCGTRYICTICTLCFIQLFRRVNNFREAHTLMSSLLKLLYSSILYRQT
jgi:hypothetical protein